jgi:hypothetical protein
MEEEFYNYLISMGRAPNTANSYRSVINSISRDYSRRTNQEIDIYEIQEQDVISEISQQYSQNGEYADAENNGIGTWRNAIARYSEFFTNRGNIATLEHNTINKTKRESTQAENILAWKEILSSSESKDFCASILKGSAELFGQTKDAKIIQTLSNIILMVVAFVCVGFLSFYELVPKGTTGVLSGIIIGYFFKKND